MSSTVSSLMNFSFAIWPPALALNNQFFRVTTKRCSLFSFYLPILHARCFAYYEPPTPVKRRAQNGKVRSYGAIASLVVVMQFPEDAPTIEKDFSGHPRNGNNGQKLLHN